MPVRHLPLHVYVNDTDQHSAQVNLTERELRRIPILFELAGAACNGEEAALSDCPGRGLGTSTEQCGVIDATSVICFSNVDPDLEGRLRLTDGQVGVAYEYGRLELFLRGFWRAICDLDSFTPASANVACSILGYDGGAPLEFRGARGNTDSVLLSSLPVGLVSVDCTGSETSLLQCMSGRDEFRQCGSPLRNFTDATVLACADSQTGIYSTPETQCVYGVHCDHCLRVALASFLVHSDRLVNN
eukprot:jgi/Ulvmu1/6020/UM260_0004.1